MRHPLRVGLVGAGANTRARHVPGLRALAEVEIVSVCNRRPESTARAAAELGIPRTFDRWEDLVADPDVDAIVIGTWPYLHALVTHAALAAGKHVLTEARLSRDATEARKMLADSRAHPRLVTQVVPSPYGLKGDTVVRELLASSYVGEVREVQVVSRNAALADSAAPLGWRQDEGLSGYNMLTLGILHETVLRWLPQPERVLAHARAFIPERIDPASGARRPVGTPDSVQVLTTLPGGAAGIYQFSGVTPFGQEASMTIYGSDGVLHYDFETDCLSGASRRSGASTARIDALTEIPIPPEKAGEWQVEADWVRSIREGTAVRLTDFATGVAYMEFTEAVARSARTGVAIELPLEE
jgi:predicted dehydrogenase